MIRGCMLQELSVLSSGFRFDDSNYDYDNSNTNVGSHLCNYRNIDLANKAKNNKYLKRALVAQVNGIS
jgi:hypothetical protein